LLTWQPDFKAVATVTRGGWYIRGWSFNGRLSFYWTLESVLSM